MAKQPMRKKKNLAFESLDIDLNKKADLSAGKEAVGAEETPEQPKKVERRKAEPAKKERTTTKKAEKPIKEKQEELIRITVDLPKSEHRKLKIQAMHADKKLYEYVYGIIKAHMDKQ